MQPLRFANVSIPTDWTGQEAKAVVGFLEEICHAIWYTHEHLILDAYDLQQDKLDSVVDEDDQMPF